MSDATTPTGAENPDSGISHQLTEAQIDKVLTDFRDWMTHLPSVPVSSESPRKPVDLFTLVEQFISLKQEVNLQTRATRTSLEQNVEALKQLAEFSQRLKETPAPAAPNFDDKLKSLLKAIIDAYDSLNLAQQQIEKQRDSFDAALETLQEKLTLDELPPVSETIPTPAEAVGFWGRLFGRKGGAGFEVNPLFAERQALDLWRIQTEELLDARQESIEDTANFIDEALSGLLTGYEMSLSRIDRVLTQFDLEPISAEGETFDPESMEAVELVRDSDASPGTVIAELRRGYLWRGVVFRYAQVKVASKG